MTMARVNAPRTDIRFTLANGASANVTARRWGAFCTVQVAECNSLGTDNLLGYVSPPPVINQFTPTTGHPRFGGCPFFVTGRGGDMGPMPQSRVSPSQYSRSSA